MDKTKLKKLPNGKGNYGECYIVDNNTLYKEFFRLDDGSYPFEKNYFNDMQGIENGTFVFPKKIYTNGDYTLGYTMDYIHAYNLELIQLDFSLSDFIIALDRLKEDLKRLTENGIVICDVNSRNILYDGKFHVIDTDLFTTEEKSGFNPEGNEKYLSEYLYYYVTEENNRYEFDDLLFSNDELYYVDKKIKNKCNMDILKDFLFELRDALLKETNFETDNFKDMYRIVKAKR